MDTLGYIESVLMKAQETGDYDLFYTIVRRFATRWYQVQYQLGREDAEDLSQSLCIKLFRQQERLRAETFRSYLTRAIRNLYIDFCRVRSHQVRTCSLESMYESSGYEPSETDDEESYLWAVVEIALYTMEEW